jgi:flagellar hook-basal body complex protein FliE
MLDVSYLQQKKKAYFNATLQYVDRSGVTNSVMESGSAAPVALSAEAASHFARALACSALQDVISNMAKANTPIKTARQIVAAAIAEIKKWEMGHKHTGELLRDMEGQVGRRRAKRNNWL